MKAKKRNEALIASQILDLCISGAGKTEIMYQANLNFNKVNYYINNLKKSGLLKISRTGLKVVYVTTSRGVEFKEQIDRIQREIDEIRSNIFEVRDE